MMLIYLHLFYGFNRPFLSNDFSSLPFSSLLYASV